MTQEEFDNAKKLVIGSIGNTLIEKNTCYGNAALAPVGVFYKGGATDSILIRLDDKYSRILNSEILRVNDVYDMLGYLFLLAISEEMFKTNEKEGFDKKVSVIQNKLFKSVNFENVNTNKNAFTKCNQTLINIDNIFNWIKENNYDDENKIFELMSCIVTYFIEENITDFSKLID